MPDLSSAAPTILPGRQECCWWCATVLPEAFNGYGQIAPDLGAYSNACKQVHNETVERYDAANNKWEMQTVPVPDAVKRAFLSACVADAY